MNPKVKGIAWLGTKTAKFDEMVKFYKEILGLPQTHSEAGFAAFRLQNGDQVEVFADDYKTHQHFSTGPVGAFEVDDIKRSRKELEEKGVEFIGPIHSGRTSKWAHFRGPDGNIYGLKWRSKDY